jgi:hypothetical protein
MDELNLENYNHALVNNPEVFYAINDGILSSSNEDYFYDLFSNFCKFYNVDISPVTPDFQKALKVYYFGKLYNNIDGFSS